MRVPRQRRYDESFKLGALRLLERGDRSINAVARALGIEWATLRKWYKEAEMAKKGKLPRSKQQTSSAVMANSDSQTDKERIAQLEHENEQLRRKNEQLEMDRAILKKAAAFFVKESE